VRPAIGARPARWRDGVVDVGEPTGRVEARDHVGQAAEQRLQLAHRLVALPRGAHRGEPEADVVGELLQDRHLGVVERVAIAGVDLEHRDDLAADAGRQRGGRAIAARGGRGDPITERRRVEDVAHDAGPGLGRRDRGGPPPGLPGGLARGEVALVATGLRDRRDGDRRARRDQADPRQPIAAILDGDPAHLGQQRGVVAAPHQRLVGVGEHAQRAYVARQLAARPLAAGDVDDAADQVRAVGLLHQLAAQLDPALGTRPARRPARSPGTRPRRARRTRRPRARGARDRRGAPSAPSRADRRWRSRRRSRRGPRRSRARA
jgi:hypothetical protein